jgi:DNA-directed RNA polymerase specialized sigma24 family protein
VANLTPNEFETLLARLDPDRDRAAEGYELLRRKLVKFFERNKCAGPEALADETIDRVAKRLEIEEVRDVSLFCFGVARRVYLESRRKAARVVSIQEHPEGEAFLADDADLEERIVEEMTQAKGLRCLEKCLGGLPPTSHHLIVEYYKGEKQARIGQRQDLAKDRGISIETLRNEAHSVRERLKGCVYRCLKKAIGGSTRFKKLAQ